MKIHRNARLALAGRHELVKACEVEGQQAAARRLNVSSATANKWWHRWQAATEAERRSSRTFVEWGTRTFFLRYGAKQECTLRWIGRPGGQALNPLEVARCDDTSLLESPSD